MTIEENIKGIIDLLPSEVTLIAVSKTRTVEDIKRVYDFGVRDFGENKVQEFLEKHEYLPDDCRWHIIGHLQRNKVKYIAGKVELIHSLDSQKLLLEIERQYSQINKVAEVLIQINIGREESKSGILCEEIEPIISSIENCNHVKVRGLMAIIPKGDENSCREYFGEMKKIWIALRDKNYKNIEMKFLSMGMSGDYKIAVEEGSNMIRVGEGIFGKRVYNNN